MAPCGIRRTHRMHGVFRLTAGVSEIEMNQQTPLLNPPPAGPKTTQKETMVDYMTSRDELFKGVQKRTENGTETGPQNESLWKAKTFESTIR